MMNAHREADLFEIANEDNLTIGQRDLTDTEWEKLIYDISC
jgi:hypothetical protein